MFLFLFLFLTAALIMSAPLPARAQPRPETRPGAGAKGKAAAKVKGKEKTTGKAKGKGKGKAAKAKVKKASAVRRLLVDYLDFPLFSVKDGELTTEEIIEAGYRPSAIRALSVERSTGAVFLAEQDAVKGLQVLDRLRLFPFLPKRKRGIKQVRLMFKRLTRSSPWRNRERMFFDIAILRRQPAHPPRPARERYRLDRFTNGGQLFPLYQFPPKVRRASRNVIRIVAVHRGRAARSGTGVFIRWGKRLFLLTARKLADGATVLRYRVPGVFSWIEVPKRDVFTSTGAFAGLSARQLKQKARELDREAKQLLDLVKRSKRTKIVFSKIKKRIKRLRTLAGGIQENLWTKQEIFGEIDKLALLVPDGTDEVSQTGEILTRLANAKLRIAQLLVQAARLRLFDFAVIRVPRSVQSKVRGAKLTAKVPPASEHMYAVGAFEKGKQGAVCVYSRTRFALLLDSKCSFTHQFSGGPLFDKVGRLVALNFAVEIRRKTGVSVLLKHKEREFGVSVLLKSPTGKAALKAAATWLHRRRPRMVRPVKFAMEAISSLGLREHSFFVAIGMDFRVLGSHHYWALRVGPTASVSSQEYDWTFGGAANAMLVFQPTRRILTGPFLEAGYSINKTVKSSVGGILGVRMNNYIWLGARLATGVHVILPEEDQDKTKVRFNVALGLAFGFAI